MAHPFVATMIGGGLEGLRSLAGVAGRKLTPFHGADGADAPVAALFLTRTRLGINNRQLDRTSCDYSPRNL
jgi:hypothetical protein